MRLQAICGDRLHPASNLQAEILLGFIDHPVRALIKRIQRLQNFSSTDVNQVSLLEAGRNLG